MGILLLFSFWDGMGWIRAGWVINSNFLVRLTGMICTKCCCCLVCFFALSCFALLLPLLGLFGFRLFSDTWRKLVRWKSGLAAAVVVVVLVWSKHLLGEMGVFSLSGEGLVGLGGEGAALCMLYIEGAVYE